MENSISQTIGNCPSRGECQAKAHPARRGD